MLQSDRHVRLIAYGLSALAGYVDAVGYLIVGGFFVSFMSGNTTRLAVGLLGDVAQATAAAALILAFLAGVIAGSTIGRLVRRRHRAVLTLVGGLLLAAAICAPHASPLLVASLMAIAMVAENAFFERDGEVQVGLTYMTGTLVKAGQRFVGALMGDDVGAWRPYAMLWLALSAGAMSGAAVYLWLGAGALYLGAASVIPVWIVAGRFDERDKDGKTPS